MVFCVAEGSPQAPSTLWCLVWQRVFHKHQEPHGTLCGQGSSTSTKHFMVLHQCPRPRHLPCGRPQAPNLTPVPEASPPAMRTSYTLHLTPVALPARPAKAKTMHQTAATGTSRAEFTMNFWTCPTWRAQVMSETWAPQAVNMTRDSPAKSETKIDGLLVHRPLQVICFWCGRQRSASLGIRLRALRWRSQQKHGTCKGQDLREVPGHTAAQMKQSNAVAVHQRARGAPRTCHHAQIF